MVNVTAVIFFGKSVKNIWNLNFFNYNHWYRISKTVKTDLFVEQSNSLALGTEQQIYSWNRATATTWNRITATTWNRITATTWNRATGQQQSSS